MRRAFLLIGMVWLLSCPDLLPQSKKTQEDSTKSQATFKVPVNVIVVNVTVTDKNGNAVNDLTAGDFKLFDDGKPQTIQTFALESYGPAPLEEKKVQEAGPQPAAATMELDRAAAAWRPDRPRMISVMIDDLTSSSPDYYPRMIKAVTDFLEKDVGPSDQVAILSSSGRVRYPFSDDRQTLLEEIGTVLGKLNFSSVTRSECPELFDLQASKISNSLMMDDSIIAGDPSFRLALMDAMVCVALDPEEEPGVPLVATRAYQAAKSLVRAMASRQTQEAEHRARVLLDTLRQHLRSMRHFEATKSLVLFSDGFLSSGGSVTSYQVQEVVDVALRSGVVLNSVDLRGLYTYVVPASEGFKSLESTSVYKQSLYQEDAFAQEDPLAQIANETGGVFFHNNNDLYQGLRDIVRRHSTYYVLTYAMPPQKPDGRYRRIKLEVSRPGLELSYRKGYYAPKEEITFERRKKEDILEALRAPGNLNEIPVSLAYNYYLDDDSRYGVSFLTNISIRGLHFLDEDARRKNLVSMVLVAFDENDHYIDGVEKTIEFRLLETSYASLLNQGLTSRVELKLPLGRYKIKAVVRESAQGKMGSITKAVEIP